MASLDSSVPFKYSGGGSLKIKDGGGNEITVTFEQGTFTWTRTGRTYTEARSRGRHESTPVVVETTDGNIALAFQCLVTSFKGNANVHPAEALTFTGNAAAWTTTGVGSKKLCEIELTMDSTPDGGGQQVATFAYCACDSVAFDHAGAEGLMQLAASLTDFENDPTIA